MPDSPLLFKTIEDTIAEDRWPWKTSKGKKMVSRIVVGKPQPHPQGHWCCPVFIEHITPHIVPAMGVGPVDALMNAMTMVKIFSDKVHAPSAVRKTVRS